MSDAVTTSEIKVIISATDKSAEEKINRIIDLLDRLDKAGGKSGETTRAAMNKVADAATAGARKVEAASKKSEAAMAREEIRAARVATAKARQVKAETAAKEAATKAEIAEIRKAAMERANAEKAARQAAKDSDPDKALREEYEIYRALERRAKMLDYIARERAKSDAVGKVADKAPGVPGWDYDPKRESDLKKTESLLDRIKASAEKATGAVAKLFGKIKSVIMYRMIRSAIRMVTDGFREGINNAYQWAKATGNAFAGSMDKIATSTQYLKNSLGALVAPLINAVAPAFEIVVDKIVDFINVINQLIAKVTNQGSWMKAVRVPKEYAAAWDDAAGSAGAAAKALTTILGIDELNPLNGANGGGGGGGGGGAGGTDYSSMFDEVEQFTNVFDNEKISGILESISSAIDALQRAIEAASPYLEIVKGWLQFILDLDIGMIKNTFDTITESLNLIADALNGDISGWDLFKGLGESLGSWAYKVWTFGEGVSQIMRGDFRGGMNTLAYLMSLLDEAQDYNLDSFTDSVEAIAGAADLHVSMVADIVDVTTENLDKTKRNLPMTGEITEIDKATGAIANAVQITGEIINKPQYSSKSIQDAWEKAKMVGEITEQKFKSENVHALFTSTDMTGNIVRRTFKNGDTAYRTAFMTANMTGNIVKRTFKSDTYESAFRTVGMTGNISNRKFKSDAYEKTFKEVKGMVANFSGTPIDSLTDAQRKIKAYANFESYGYSSIATYRKDANGNSKAFVDLNSYANITGHSALGTLNANVDFSGITYNGKPWLDVILNVKKMLVDGTDKKSSITPYLARGGAFYGGQWHDIAQYATGGLPSHGTLFAAGESGAEVVGHIGGRTEVLNQSQLASTMAAATQMGMASQNGILQQIASGISQLVEGQGDVRAYIPAGEVVTGLQRNNRRDGRALVPMGV